MEIGVLIIIVLTIVTLERVNLITFINEEGSLTRCRKLSEMVLQL